MSNAEGSSVPVATTEPRPLLRVESLPSERHPAAVYLSSLGHSSSSMAERYARPNEEAMKSILSALDSTRAEVIARVSKPDGHRKKSNSFSNSSEDVGVSRGV